jgi:hypothetical protein
MSEFLASLNGSPQNSITVNCFKSLLRACSIINLKFYFYDYECALNFKVK